MKKKAEDLGIGVKKNQNNNQNNCPLFLSVIFKSRICNKDKNDFINSCRIILRCDINKITILSALLLHNF